MFAVTIEKYWFKALFTRGGFGPRDKGGGGKGKRGRVGQEGMRGRAGQGERRGGRGGGERKGSF